MSIQVRRAFEWLMVLICCTAFGWRLLSRSDVEVLASVVRSPNVLIGLAPLGITLSVYSVWVAYQFVAAWRTDAQADDRRRR